MAVNPFLATPKAGAAAPATGPRRLGRNPPPRPTPQTPAQAEKDIVELEAAKLELAEKQRKAEMAKGLLPKALDDLITEINTAADAHRLSRTNSRSTGWGNWAFGSVPTSSGMTMNDYMTTLGGNIAFSSLQEMRNLSPTGGALGNVTVPELQMLRSSEAPLNPQADPEVFRQSLETILNNRKRVIFKLPGGRERYRAWREGWLDKYYPDRKKGKGKAPGKGDGGWSIEEVK